MSSTYQPYLPHDIEREIFETTARLHWRSASDLMLVARRVKVWIEPIVYEVVKLNPQEKSGHFIRTMDIKPSNFFARRVKNVCIPYNIPVQQAIRILSVCTSVDNLACWIRAWNQPELFSTMKTLRPRHLSVHLQSLLGECGKPDFSDPFFSKVTHLRLVDEWWSWIDWSGFGLMPSLTHIALDCSEPDIQLGFAIHQILEECKSLKVCLVVVSKEDEGRQMNPNYWRAVRDPRLVTLNHPDPIGCWEGGLTSCPNTCQWTVADSIVRKQMARQ
jgi:hypothetical protein